MKSILEYLEITTLTNPTKTAFICEENSITFSELEKKSQIFGAYLTKKIYKVKNKPIGIIADKNIDTLICMLACLYTGNYYVIIDSELPLKRIDSMIQSTDFILLINSSNKNIFIGDNYKQTVVNYKNIEFKEIMHEYKKLINEVRVECLSIDPMYGIFTSGSTGIPKLVVKSHRSLISFIDSFVDIFDFKSDEVLGNQFPFYFDASTKDIFVCLKCGITTHIIPKILFSFPYQLIEYLQNNKITTIIWVPSALVLVANTKALDGEYDLPLLRKVFFVGEQMPLKQLNYWKRKMQTTRFINLYGSTEVAGNFLFYEYEFLLTDETRLPIGKPFPNVKVFLLNEKNELVKNSQIGEICVTGETLSLGYYNRKDLTRLVFIENPLVPYREIIYKTGDLAVYDEDNNIIWKSRKDFQIKHMGFRIELSEIEIVVGSISEIEECCCVYDDTNKRIILFYQAKDDLKNIIGKKIRLHLPKYMYPSKYYKLSKMPHNANGKIDRRYLNNQVKVMEK